VVAGEGVVVTEEEEAAAVSFLHGTTLFKLGRQFQFLSVPAEQVTRRVLLVRADLEQLLH
jgi:hypothetical protein